MSRSCMECVHNNPNDPSDLAYACLNCSWPTLTGEPTNFKSKSITNADRIRAMSDVELAHFLEMKAGRFVSFYPTPAKNWLDWLKEVNDGKEEKEENQPAK